MEISDHFTVYEYCDMEGHPHQYCCNGHIDSERFREECQKKYSIRPLVVQHRWQRTKRIVKQDPERKRARGYTTEVACLDYERGAKAVTVGLVRKDRDPYHRNQQPNEDPVRADDRYWRTF
ncbi:MAG: hypothetical protein GY866_09070 [Proteobacteria bacterium]|nr:hypothetical protein [Pseudomonadota bacterium]